MAGITRAESPWTIAEDRRLYALKMDTDLTSAEIAAKLNEEFGKNRSGAAIEQRWRDKHILLHVLLFHAGE